MQSWQTAIGCYVSTPDLSFCQAKSMSQVQQWEMAMPEDAAVHRGHGRPRVEDAGRKREGENFWVENRGRMGWHDAPQAAPWPALPPLILARSLLLGCF
jgi:hypothetical protein